MARMEEKTMTNNYKPVKEMSYIELYIEAYGSLVEPFPRLRALRSFPLSQLSEDNQKELGEMMKKETEYYRRKSEVKEELYKRVVENNKQPFKSHSDLGERSEQE